MLYYPLAGLGTAGTAWFLLQKVGVPQLVDLGAAIVVGVLAMMAWSYSPLPDHNGGMLAGTENTGWGW